MPLNLCTTFGEDFASLEAFDAHRVGEYAQTGPSEYSERLARGFVDPAEVWGPEEAFGRRCLTVEEMELREQPLVQDAHGRWVLAHRQGRAQRAFATDRLAWTSLSLA
jgi:hypothetical protein